MSYKDRHDAWARNFNKYRLMGVRNSIAGVIGRGGNNMTDGEATALNRTIDILDDVLDKYEPNSIELGFKDVGKRVGVNRGTPMKDILKERSSTHGKR